MSASYELVGGRWVRGEENDYESDAFVAWVSARSEWWWWARTSPLARMGAADTVERAKRMAEAALEGR